MQAKCLNHALPLHEEEQPWAYPISSGFIWSKATPYQPSAYKKNLKLKLQTELYAVPALGVGRVGSRLGPQDLGGPQMPKIGPQLVAMKRSRYPNRTVTTLIEQSIIQSSRTLKSS